METTTLGRGGPVVSRAGLGLMGMSGIYGQADDHESIATIHAAVDAGITLLDTGDFYGMGHNELLLRDALRRGIPRDSVFIQVKFGGQRDPSGSSLMCRFARPLQRSAETSRPKRGSRRGDKAHRDGRLMPRSASRRRSTGSDTPSTVP